MASREKAPAPTPFGDWLMDQLSRKDWSQRKLAEKTGVTSGAVSRWVRGLDVPGSENVARIADAFGLDPAIVMHRVVGSPGGVGFLAALEEELTDEELRSVQDYARFVKARRPPTRQ